MVGVAGLRWLPGGQVVLSGPLYRLFAACDAAFTALADTWGAAPEEHPATIDAAAFRSFGCREADLDAGGDVLSPAACYHVYLHHRGEQLPAATFLTTRNTCYRRSERYEPLRRQRSFRTREIVCLGTREEVTGFLVRARLLVDTLLRELSLPVEWVTATGGPPSRHEARFGEGGDSDDGSGEDLAIASVNLHEERFGEAFGIGRAGRPAVSGCVAFGLERWLYAIIRRHGSDPGRWPDVAAAVRRALAAVAAGTGRAATR
jgi:hypothetical protein